MNSYVLGRNTPETEVTHISSHGIWLLLNNKELFLPYAEFPWFIDRPVKATFMLKNDPPVILLAG